MISPHEPRTANGRSRLALPLLVVLAVVLRMAFMIPRAGARAHDPDNYLPLAQALARGEGFFFNGRLTAFRPPLYPLILAPLVAVGERHLTWLVFGLHAALGAGTVVAVAAAARRWGLTLPRQRAAAFVVACDPVLVVQGRSVMTETLAAFLVAVTLAALADRQRLRGCVLGGLSFGLAALCRPSLLPAAALAAVGIMVGDDAPLRGRLRRAIALVLAVVATLLPWALRNTWLFGEPVWTTTHGGYTLSLANNPYYYHDVLDDPAGTVWSGPSQKTWSDWVNRETAGLTEPQADRRLTRAVLALLADRPREFARAALARLGRFWGIGPSGSVYPRWLRLAIASWTVPLWLALGAGLCRRDTWRWPRVAAAAVLLGLTAVHAFYWTDLRMRAPAVPAIALVAACALGRSQLRASSDPAPAVGPEGTQNPHM